jgi:hypothetical protein
MIILDYSSTVLLPVGSDILEYQLGPTGDLHEPPLLPQTSSKSKKPTYIRIELANNP